MFRHALAFAGLVGGVLMVHVGFAAEPIQDKTPHRLQPFDMTRVRLLDGRCKSMMASNTRYLLYLEPDRLLYSFRATAGLDHPGKPYGDWESADCELRGHFVGHYLSACALTYASTGDQAIKRRGDLMVAEMAKCQQRIGTGYLSAYPDSFFDRLEQLGNPPWAPYYTMHKIMAGLYDMYRLCGNKQALECLKGMADYFDVRIGKVPEDRWLRILNVEYGGMSEVLHNLYATTGEPRYLALAHKFDKEEFLSALAQHKDNLAGRHGNTHIPIVIGEARHYELTGEPEGHDAAVFFWDAVVNHHSYATGGSTNAEHWGPPDKLAHELSTTNHEVCKTYNMLKLTRKLIEWTGDAKYGDYYERAWLNGIWGTQGSKLGELEYYIPMMTGAHRSFGTPDGSFWCCYGTGVENFAKLADSIYFHDDYALTVNLYVASELNWQEKGVRLTQATRYPEEDHTRLTMHVRRPTELTVRLRIPSWATRGAKLSLNGEPLSAKAKPGAYAAIKRVWRDGDVLALTLPMGLSAMPMPDDHDMVAVMYGPQVLAGVLEPPIVGQVPDQPYAVVGDAAKPTSWLKRVGSGIRFRADVSGRPIDFVPFNTVVGQRYGLYWTVVKPGSARAQAIERERKELAALAARTIDEVVPQVSEAPHRLRSEGSNSGTFGGRTWRDAVAPGWWSWQLKVLPDKPMTLVCTYWGSDQGNRRFDIEVDGSRIATQVLDASKPGQFFDVTYAIPADLTQGKSTVSVRFVAPAGCTAGGVFRCAVLRP